VRTYRLPEFSNRCRGDLNRPYKLPYGSAMNAG
jgi:hypothetical protein